MSEEESSGIGFGTVAGVGTALAGGIGLLLNRKKAVKEARQFLKDTKPRDLTLDETAKVDEVIKKDVIPDPDINQRALVTLEQSKKFVKEADDELGRIEQAVVKQPLTMGGTADKNELYGVGPALYDYVAKLPNKKAKTPGEWSSIFRSKMDLEYIEPGTGAMRKRAVPLQEVEDAAIATYDTRGNLKGGVLFDLVQDPDGKKAKLSIPTILSFIRGSPSNNIKVIKYGTTNFKKQADDYVNDLRVLDKEITDANELTRGLNKEQLKKKIRDLKKMPASEDTVNNLRIAESVLEKKTSLNNYTGLFEYGIQTGTVNNILRYDVLPNTLEYARSIGVSSRAIENVSVKGRTFDELFYNRDTVKNNFNRNKVGQNVDPVAKYSEAYNRNYRYMGSEDYFEDILYMDNDMIEKLPREMQSLYNRSHYSTDPTGKNILGQFFHIRGGTRKVEGPGGKKATVASEIQSDELQTQAKNVVRIRDNFIQKTLRGMNTDEGRKLSEKYSSMTNEERLASQPIKEAAKSFYQKATELRQNPFNRQDLNNLLNRDTLKDKSDELMSIAAKGRYMTKADQMSFNKIADEIDYIKSSAPKQTPPRMPSGDELPYVPFNKDKEWAGLSIRYLLRKAAKDGTDYVAIEPFELVGFKRGDGKVVKQLEWYGNYRGGGSAKINLSSKNSRQQRDMSPKVITKVPKAPGSGKAMIPYSEVKDGPAALPDAMKTLAKRYDLKVGEIRLAKSDPDKPFKVLGDTKDYLNPDTGEIYNAREHIAAFKTIDEIPLSVNRGNVIEMQKGDSDLYYEAFSIQVRPEFKNIPMTTYKKGGLVVDLFKWS